MSAGSVAPLVDTRLALWSAAVAAPVDRPDPDAVQALRHAVADDLPAIDRAARRFTDLGTDLSATTVRVVGRTAWVRANLEVIAATLEPLRPRFAARPVLARRVLSIQLGGLLGLLSVKVLGQYVLPLAGPGTGQLLVVGPNVQKLTEHHGALADDIRRTVVLHEVTHRLQFDGTAWLGDHLRGLIRRYLEHARVDADRLAALAPRLPELLRQVRREGEIQPLLGAVLTEEQLSVVDEAQGLMSLLEGHGNATMYGAQGAGIIDPEGVRAALATRQGDVTSKLLTAVAGLEMKRRQYREGEVFVRHVLDRAGTAGLNHAFAGPDQLPGAEEVGDPDAWLARVDGP